MEDYGKVKAARAALERAEARAAAAVRPAGQGSGAGPVRNTTDLDSRLMPVRGGGFIQGCNAQDVTSGDKLIIATELTCDPAGSRWFAPMPGKAEDGAALITAHRPAVTRPGRYAPGRGIGQLLADAGYCSEHNLTVAGPDRLIATGKHRDLEKAARGQEQAGQRGGGPATQAMSSRLKTPEAITAYRQRGHIAETPHGQIKHNMGIRRLALRGKPKAAAEWTFTCAVHNLLKAITTGHLTPAALAALPS